MSTLDTIDIKDITKRLKGVTTDELARLQRELRDISQVHGSSDAMVDIADALRHELHDRALLKLISSIPAEVDHGL